MIIVEPKSAQVIEDMPFDEYADLPALNQSTVKLLLQKSPLHAHKRIKTSTTSMTTGSLAHQIAFGEIDPDRDLMPYEGRRAGKDWALFESHAAASGKKAVSVKEFIQMKDMSDGMPGFHKALIAACKKEVTILFDMIDIDSGNTIAAKARIDLLGTSIIDYKTTSKSIQLAGFQREIGAYFYDLQAAWYQKAVYAGFGTMLPFEWIAQETAAPYDVNMFRASEQCLANGNSLLYEGVSQWMECAKSGIYSGHFKGVQEIDSPTWHLFEPELVIEGVREVSEI